MSLRAVSTLNIYEKWEIRARYNEKCKYSVWNFDKWTKKCPKCVRVKKLDDPPQCFQDSCQSISMNMWVETIGTGRAGCGCFRKDFFLSVGACPLLWMYCLYICARAYRKQGNRRSNWLMNRILIVELSISYWHLVSEVEYNTGRAPWRGGGECWPEPERQGALWAVRSSLRARPQMWAHPRSVRSQHSEVTAIT